ncbi:hypothetical protein [Burkholderia cenocepacia]|jgi:hypothetical protein
MLAHLLFAFSVHYHARAVDHQMNRFGDWERLLPALVATRGLMPSSFLKAIEHFVATPQPPLAIEREFSTGDPVLTQHPRDPHDRRRFLAPSRATACSTVTAHADL